ncbi:DNA ligase-like domain-containing protein [Streptomyces tauricus]|uniref:hypothetical protein n=1 Tax=Streptomyces tauricus TaxID=68274 RepID=UPI002244A02E|nr:hypothetical protein [Streptomyces tauricus]MCW8103193.1 hypothetical protein [Streptomyces tauricus]
MQLSDATALDGEPIVWSAHGRLTFEQLQNRLHRRGPATLQAASSRPAHFVAFDACAWPPLAVRTAPHSP